MRDDSRWRSEIRMRLEKLRLPPEEELEIVEELAGHLEDEYQKAVESGASHGQATQQALEELTDARLEELGDVKRPASGWVSKELKAGAGGNVVTDLWQDVRYALRTMRRNPGFSALAALSLALGIGGNAAMFSIVSAVLLQPLPYPGSERLVRAADTGSYPPGGVVALQEQSRTMEVAGYRAGTDLNLTGQGEAWRLTGSTVSANLFEVLQVGAQSGRTFRSGEDQQGKDALVMLSDSLWREKFGGDVGVIGKVINLGGVDREVVGVMPRRFAFPDTETRFWIPLHLDPRNPASYWAEAFLPVMARLRPGATLEQAQKEIQSLSREMIALYPYPMGRDFNAKATVIPLQEFLVGNLRLQLLVLQCAIGLVLLIACANVANLLLARASSRQKEMALRVALGAARGRIVRQLLTESMVLAGAGGVVGLILAWWCVPVLQLILPAQAASWSEFTIGWQVLLFTGGMCVVTGLSFGLAPAWMSFSRDLTGLIKTGGQRTSGTAGGRFRSALIVAEVAVAVVLSVGAGLLLRSLWLLTQVDPGFRPEHILTLRVTPNQTLCGERARCSALYEELLRRVKALPGSGEVAAASTIPLSEKIPTVPVEVEGFPHVPSERVAPLFWAGAVTQEYFDLMRVPIVMGRGFAGGDSEAAEPVIVVSAATAAKYWPGQNPIGKHVRVVFEQKWRTVVGVAGDVRQFNLANRAPNQIAGEMYMPYRQAVDGERQQPAAMTLIVRTVGDSGGVTAGIRGLVRDLNPNVPVSEVRMMAAVVSASTRTSRSMAWLLGGFAGVALLLAAVGAYGVVSWSTAQRTFEIGMRMALGAPRSSVFRLVLGQSLRLVAMGLALGVAASLVLTRVLGAYLYATGTWDVATFVSVSSVLVGVALLAGYFPARRAASVDPLRALRVE
ncbi:MAG: ABC transporter permease [Acidobacteria bacterium]|nr:ABC transporter permease [Acidobacteriota bacterium]